jgi:hypothetical protein
LRLDKTYKRNAVIGAASVLRSADGDKEDATLFLIDLFEGTATLGDIERYAKIGAELPFTKELGRCPGPLCGGVNLNNMGGDVHRVHLDDDEITVCGLCVVYYTGHSYTHDGQFRPA